MKPPRIVFLQHEATRTGAPVVLLRFLRWLTKHHDYDIRLVVLRSGELLPELRAAVPTTLVETLPGLALRKAHNLGKVLEKREDRRLGAALRGVAGAARQTHLRHRLPDVRDADLIYANTVATGAVFDLLPRDRPPIVTHVHELGFSLDSLMPDGATERSLGESAHFIACAQQVRDELHGRGIEESMITVCPEILDLTELDLSPAAAGDVLAELGIPAGSFVVGGSGTRDWRKGPDLFVRVASEIRRRHPRAPIHFIWVGGSGEPDVTAQLEYDAKQLGCSETVHFVPPTSVPHRYFAALDVLAMTSREDPYPLVCLEAALHEVPVVTFESGGASDFARSGAGSVVPYADVVAMADEIADLATDHHRRAALGSAARVAAEAHDVRVVGPQIVEVIERVRRR